MERTGDLHHCIYVLNEGVCVSLYTLFMTLKYKFCGDAGTVKNGHCFTVQFVSGRGFNPSPCGKMESDFYKHVLQWRSGRTVVWGELQGCFNGKGGLHNLCSHTSLQKRGFHCKFSTWEQMTCFVLGDWYEQLYPLVITLKDCMGEVVTRAKQSMAFVLLQELACGLPQCLMLTLRRDIVFSQAVGCLVSLISFYCCNYKHTVHASVRNFHFVVVFFF